ncbi:MAG: hypothetical protein ACI8PT_000535 [Gammaproteobacteria bacterium]|jgi:hypothetical protein
MVKGAIREGNAHVRWTVGKVGVPEADVRGWTRRMGVFFVLRCAARDAGAEVPFQHWRGQ